MIIEIIKNTPIWVFVLLAILVYKGINAMKPRSMKLSKLFIMPAIFIYFAINKISSDYSFFLIALSVGYFLGWLIYKNTVIKADKARKIITVPGNIAPLILILFAFAKGYFIGYETSVNPQLISSTISVLIITFASGISSGIFLGRTGTYIYKYYKAEHNDITHIIKKTKIQKFSMLKSIET